MKKEKRLDGNGTHRPIIPAPRRQRYVNLHELEASLVYREFQESKGYTKKPVS